MFAKLTLRAGRESSWFKSTRFSRAIKVATATFAILYLIIGTAAAAGYESVLRTSHNKAAQNMAMRSVADDVRAHGITVCVLSPGMVNTAGEIPEERRFPGVIDPPESIAGMIAVIDQLTLDDSGKFIRYTGEEQPW